VHGRWGAENEKTRLDVGRGLVCEKFHGFGENYFLNPLTLLAGAAGAGVVCVAQAPSPKATAMSATSAVIFMVWFPLLSKPVGVRENRGTVAVAQTFFLNNTIRCGFAARMNPHVVVCGRHGRRNV
jgi:hypothetical protein